MADTGVGNFARTLLGQGLAMGWGDEAEAWLRSKLGNETYEDAYKDIQKQLEGYRTRNPITSGVTELAGGLLPMAASYAATPITGGAAAPVAAASTAKTAGTLARLAQSPVIRGMLTGAGTGAISGAGAAKPDSRGSGAAVGAGMGTVIGGSAPIVMRGAGAGYGWLRDRVLPSEESITRRAAGKVNQALETAQGGRGMTPAEAGAKVMVDQVQGVPSVMVNADPALVELADTVAQRSGAGARRLEETLGRQKEGARERVYGRTKSELGGKSFYEQENEMVDALRKQASTLYDEAYAVGSVRSPIIENALKDPQFKVFYDKAREIAEREGLAAKLRGEDPSKFKLEEIYKVDKDGNAVLAKVPDVRTLDYIKRGIDATIERGFKGEGMSTAEANALKDLRKVFVKAIDEATVDPRTGVSPYAAARKAYAGDMEVLDALRSGMNDFRKLDSEEIVKRMAGYGPAEKEAFRTGVIRNIYDQIMVPSTNLNAAQRLVGSPEMVAKLQPLFESPAKFELFKSALERESQLFQQANRVLGGSQTGRRTQQRQAFEAGTPVGEVVADVITSSGGFFNSVTNLAARAARSAKMTDEIANKVSKMLSSSEPSEVAAAVKLLEDYGKKEAVGSARQLTREAGVIGGLTNLAQPDPYLGEGGQRDIPRELTIKRDNIPRRDIAAEIAAEEARKKKLTPGTSMGR